MLKNLILITILFHLHNFASAANVEEKKGLKVKERFSSNSFIIKGAKASTVILSHGSGGVWKHTYMWKDRLNNQGYNVVIIDHHKEKDIKPHIGRRNYKDFPEERVKDLLKLSRWIKKQKWNKGKIGIIGFSYGGAGTNLLANNLELELIENRFAEIIT